LVYKSHHYVSFAQVF